MHTIHVLYTLTSQFLDTSRKQHAPCPLRLSFWPRSWLPLEQIGTLGCSQVPITSQPSSLLGFSIGSIPTAWQMVCEHRNFNMEHELSDYSQATYEVKGWLPTTYFEEKFWSWWMKKKHLHLIFLHHFLWPATHSSRKRLGDFWASLPQSRCLKFKPMVYRIWENPNPMIQWPLQLWKWDQFVVAENTVRWHVRIWQEKQPFKLIFRNQDL